MTIDIDINRQDYSDFNKHHFLKTRLFRTTMTGVLTIVLVEYFLNKDHFDLFGTIVSGTIAGLVYVFLIARQLRNSKNIPKDDGSILGKKTLTFNDNAIICIDRNSTTQLNWTSIKSIDSAKTAFYLYIDTNMAIILPKRHFTDDAEQKKLVEMIKTKINAA